MTSTTDKMMSNGRRAAMLMVLTSMVLSLSLRDALRSSIASTSYERTDNRSAVNQSDVNAEQSVIGMGKDKSGAKDQTRPAAKGKEASDAKRNLPIYLLHPDKESVSQISWETVAASWNRTATYTDLIELSKPTAALPSAEGRRPVVMIHCGPKSGSTTLRVACRQNLEKTCGIKPNGRLPKGYQNETELYPIIRSCPNTNHFCTKETVIPMDVPTFEDTTFVHMFPFRTYDEWAASALKQAFDRGRETECSRVERLVDKCIPSKMEIDFRKYGKTDLAKFKEFAVPRMNKKNESHIFILYYHRDLDKVLSMLSGVYKIPLLPGSDGHGKETRPEGTCDESILKKYHDCFSSQLMELK